ncbi:nitroreductase family protein [Atopobiaceae bacterium 24-176]
MDYMKLIAERYSVRDYAPKPVEQEKVDLILKAAQLAPTAVNYQPFKVLVLRSERALKTLRAACRSTYDAPLAFLVCSDEKQTWKSRTEPGYSSGEMDSSIVATHMMLESWNLGLGSCWVRLFSVDTMRQAFELPANLVPRCLLVVGYAAPDAKPYAPWHDVYKPIEEISIML